MKNVFFGALCCAAMTCFCPDGWAHLSVGSDRTLNGGNPIDNSTAVNNSRSVSSSFGWADGTDDTFGDSHRLTAFKFTLGSVQDVTISVTGADGLLPGFSLYAANYPNGGAAHDGTTFQISDFTTSYGSMSLVEPFTDTNTNSIWNVGEDFTDTNGNGVHDNAGLGSAELGYSGKEGAFRALTDWHMYNDAGTKTDFIYIGHAADGTSANYGSFGAVNGDGLADGYLTYTFSGLGAGSYILLVGGANYLAQNTEEATFPAYGIELTVQAVPEPSAMPLLLAALMGFTFLPRRGKLSRGVS